MTTTRLAFIDSPAQLETCIVTPIWSGDDDDFLDVLLSPAANDIVNDVAPVTLLSSPSSQKKNAMGDETASYVERLYTLLEECPNEIAMWTEGGSAFAILDPPAFESTLLPAYLQPVKFASFLRQLNSYRFKTIKRGIAALEFSHPKFIRGRPGLLRTIKRRHRVRPSRAGTNTVKHVTRQELASALHDLVASVHLLRTEMDETKALVRSMMVDDAECSRRL
ncbi:Aste57867_21022 [Aphanomyces stellatus]|uniref:Aste57867_21022 protein n=1 Tax=Aphanomyces stellatus TaxID=120398 RepID=A0A485LGK7_9STRA|nr:hypothetical protein As57867_020954 [Aphanomyces stellatus]VFT97697.1 Aste57867_21022 [Aphanomyces stellatus]